MCGNTFMPDSVTSACRFMWSVHRLMKIGTGNELPDTVKMWHMGKPVPRRSEKRPYRNGRLALPACKPLQRPKIGFRKRRNPFVGNYTSRMAKPRIWAVLRLLWLRLHELQDIASVSGRGHCRLPTVANLWHEGKKWAIGLVGCLEICRASQAHCHYKICCAFITSENARHYDTCLWTVYHL